MSPFHGGYVCICQEQCKALLFKDMVYHYDFFIASYITGKKCNTCDCCQRYSLFGFFVLPRDQLLKFPRYQEKYLQYQYNNTRNILLQYYTQYKQLYSSYYYFLYTIVLPYHVLVHQRMAIKGKRCQTSLSWIIFCSIFFQLKLYKCHHTCNKGGKKFIPPS